MPPIPIVILGEALFAKDGNGKLRSRIATAVPGTRTLVTIPTVHLFQRHAYLDWLRKRSEAGHEPLSAEDESPLSCGAVDLIVGANAVYIRPDPDNMDLAFEADEMLQEMVPKKNVKFLEVLNPKVREAIKRRGEAWRITPLPTSREERMKLVAAARIGIRSKEIYYYNAARGTRWLTYQEFAALESMDDVTLREQLMEICEFSANFNSLHNREVDFFMAHGFSWTNFQAHDWAAMKDAELRATYELLRGEFRAAVPPEFRHDDPDNSTWCHRMCATLLGQTEELISEEELLGLGLEFFQAVRWLPGGRIEDGLFFFDSIFQEAERSGDDELRRLCDPAVRQFIGNFLLECGDLEYVNIAKVTESLTTRELQGRREVYIAELKRASRKEETVCHIRYQKFGTREHLMQGMKLDQALLEDAKYTDYILDRWLACRQLRLNVPPRLNVRHVTEQHGHLSLRCAYFHRQYVRGVATDKLPPDRFENDEFAMRFATLLGREAAANMIVGRCDEQGRVLFDDGDEIVVEDKDGMPVEIVAAEDTGSFRDYQSDLRVFGKAYAAKVAKRMGYVRDPEGFFSAFLGAFTDRFVKIQEDYRSHRGHYDTLFQHRPRDANGSFAYRWEKVLERLDRTKPEELAAEISRHVPQPV